MAIGMVAALACGSLPTVAHADDSVDNGDASTAPFVLSVLDAGNVDPLVGLFDIAESNGLELKSVAFSGEEGVGRLQIVPGEPANALAARTADLFGRSHTQVPPVVGAVVEASVDRVTGVIESGDFTADLQPITEEEVLTPSLPLVELAPESDLTAASAPQAQAVAATTNNWPTYFPGEWRNEARNVLRCTYYANGRCWSTAQRAFLNQSVKWTGSAGTAVPWPFNDWGFEYGTTLINAPMCNSSTRYQGWWLESLYSEWSTSVPASAGPYVEGNRLFDDCDKMGHEVGIRDPQMLTQGYQYTFTVSSPRNAAQPSTKMSAAYQVLHDDCVPGVALTNCMGLNTNISWPYSTAQSAVVVNSTRNFTVPGCARMYRNWTAPIRWSNGTSRLLPAPLNLYDSCLANDY